MSARTQAGAAEFRECDGAGGGRGAVGRLSWNRLERVYNRAALDVPDSRNSSRPVEIVAPLGAGGMGVVYRSRDTRLDRAVAVKVLAPHLASNAELRARFEREARAISALSHPHICTLHD